MGASTGLKTKFFRNEARIAYVAGITPPGMQREMVEIEELDPQDGIKQKKPGVIELGEFSVTLNFDPKDEGHTALQADLDDGIVQDYAIELPSGARHLIEARVVGFVPQAISAGAVIQAEVTLDVVSKPEYEDPED